MALHRCASRSARLMQELVVGLARRTARASPTSGGLDVWTAACGSADDPRARLVTASGARCVSTEAFDHRGVKATLVLEG